MQSVLIMQCFICRVDAPAGLAKGYLPIHEADVDDWELMIDANCKGAPHILARVHILLIFACVPYYPVLYTQKCPSNDMHWSTAAGLLYATRAVVPGMVARGSGECLPYR